MASSSMTKALKTTTKWRTAAFFAALASNPTLRQTSPFAAASSHPFSSASAADASPISSQNPGSQRTWWSKWLLFLPGAITFGLGTWQIVRRQEKIKMLKYRQQRLAADPVSWKSASTTSDECIDDALEFRRILCKGVFDETRSIFVGPRSRSISGVTENGYYLITPLVPISDDTDSVHMPILVNRGWVPRYWRDKSINDASHKAEQPKDTFVVPREGQDKHTWWRFWSKKQQTIKDQAPDVVASVEVIGVIRGSEKPSVFVPPNDPNSFQWFYVDVPAIARACGLPETTLYIEDINENINPSNPYPIPKDANTLIRTSVMPQDHLNYTITWYSLSAAVTYMAFKRIKPRKIQARTPRTK